MKIPEEIFITEFETLKEQLYRFALVETADILKLPQGTVATRQRRALSLLRLELEVE